MSCRRAVVAVVVLSLLGAGAAVKGSKKVRPAKLRAKAKVTVLVTLPGAYGTWFEATIQKGVHFPKTRRGCLAVGSETSRVACPR